MTDALAAAFIFLTRPSSSLLLGSTRPQRHEETSEPLLGVDVFRASLEGAITVCPHLINNCSHLNLFRRPEPRQRARRGILRRSANPP
ncbi:unnamed protein product [Miscanthus lutarioriparius]|uniref:Uncharacterized protein n=1 Tax=Miscanthus lutarioriparius TaxID=422564 RepID=A0A811PNA3_9POAL|nr:unnamed protein product [Miscanthus lutarioriparius]